MVRVHNYNKEKNNNGFSDVYLIALVLGLVGGFLFIGGGIGLIFLLKLAVEYWVWVVVIVVVVVLATKFFRKGRA